MTGFSAGAAAAFAGGGVSAGLCRRFRRGCSSDGFSEDFSTQVWLATFTLTGGAEETAFAGVHTALVGAETGVRCALATVVSSAWRRLRWRVDAEGAAFSAAAGGGAAAVVSSSAGAEADVVSP